MSLFSLYNLDFYAGNEGLIKLLYKVALLCFLLFCIVGFKDLAHLRIISYSLLSMNIKMLTLKPLLGF